MLKEKIDRLRAKNLIFQNVQSINPKSCGVKKRLDILKCVDASSYYHLILFIEAKSRFLQKNAREIEEVFNACRDHFGHNIKYKTIFIANGLCSKAKELLQNNDWKVYNE